MIHKDVIKLSVPIIAEQTFIMIMGVTNTIMAGHLGKEAVSAIGMVDSINNIFIAFFSALAVGGSVVVAQYIGQGDIKNANEAARHAMLSGTALSIITTLAIFFIRNPLIALLYGSAEQEVVNNSLIYLGITLLTYPFIAVTSIACGVLRGTGDTKTPMRTTIIMNLLNVLLSYTLIYGLEIGSKHFKLSIPGLGVRGAAIGIAAARTIGTGMIMYTLLNGSKLIKLTVERSFKLNILLLRSIFGIGIPASVESMLFNAGKLITQIFIVGMGTASIAANYIASSVLGLITIPGAALGIAATTLVGQCMGRGESDTAEETMLYLTKLSSLCLLVLCGFTFPLSGFLASLYTQSSDVMEITSGLLKSCAIAAPVFWSASFLLPAGLKGAGDAKYTMAISVFSMWVFRITLGYILGVPLKMGVLGVWMAMYADWLVRTLFFYARVKSGKWKQKIVIRHPGQAF